MSIFNASNNSDLECIVGSELYASSVKMVSRALLGGEFDTFKLFCTWKDDSNFRFAGDMAAIQQLNSQYIMSGTQSKTCMFMYEGFDKVPWEKRVCGSTDNHLGRSHRARRGFFGDILQYRELLTNMCCDTEELNKRISSYLHGIFVSAAEGLLENLSSTIQTAIFAPFREFKEGTDTCGVEKTFEDDSSLIDLTGALTLKKIAGALSVVSSLKIKDSEFYWLVPQSIFAEISSADFVTNSCCSVGIAQIWTDGTYKPHPNGLQFKSPSKVKIFSMPDDFFPVDGNGKLITPLIPKGAIAFTITAPAVLAMSIFNTGMRDLMSFSQYAFEKEYQRVLGPSAIRAYLSPASSDKNYNAEMSLFTAITAGRLPGNWFRIIVDPDPTFSDQPSQVTTSSVNLRTKHA